ncbi:MAG: SsrA-binding protein SmpB [Bacteriovoracaceae bacterium]|nr:SsrA-binding protein SmpB [Bacteriovoracaceae bacterium]
MGIKVIINNKRVGFDYFIEEKFEAGIMLQGTEVKSLRAGKGNITDAFVTIDDQHEVWCHNMLIPHYAFGNLNNHEETRKRKLLLNKSEILNLKKQLMVRGLTLVLTSVYFKESNIKVEVALVKGKKLHDKRESAAKKDVERKLRRGEYD